MVALGGFLISNALAVHDEAFQLDGDVSASTTTNFGGHTQGVDWDSLFDSNHAKKTLPTDFNASGFDVDFLTTSSRRDGTVFDSHDSTTYATGSKDTLPITGSKSGSGWQCARSNNVGGKVDIMNAYAAAYTDPSSGHQILYFGQERFSNAGDANVGFWFLQDGSVACTGGGGATDFTGHHQDGDLFVVSAFTSGGVVSTIDVYKWSGDDTGSLGSTPVVHGVDCKSITLPPDPADADDACAEVNSGTISTPWQTANQDDGVDHSLREAEFFEGGVDLTAHNLGGKCFNTFISNTRSSQSLTATLFDFAVGQLGLCSISTAQKWFPQDTANVTGGLGGTVVFKLYESGDCSGTPAKTYSDSSAPYETNQTDYPVTAGTTISWSATFTPTGGDPIDVTRCEKSVLTINNSASDFPPPSP
jgi:hypothetical protein